MIEKTIRKNTGKKALKKNRKTIVNLTIIVTMKMSKNGIFHIDSTHSHTMNNCN